MVNYNGRLILHEWFLIQNKTHIPPLSATIPPQVPRNGWHSASAEVLASNQAIRPFLVGVKLSKTVFFLIPLCRKAL